LNVGFIPQTYEEPEEGQEKGAPIPIPEYEDEKEDFDPAEEEKTIIR
jgi:hypothetical protein